MSTCLSVRCSTLLALVASFVTVCALSSSSARADTIASVSGTTINGDPLDVSDFLYVSWTSTTAYQDVTIDATLGIMSGPDPTVTAYLTTAIGPSATAASEVTAPTTVSVSGPASPYTLFTLPTLAAGTYYLVLSGDAGGQQLQWDFADGTPTVTTATDTTLNTSGVADDFGDGTPNIAYPPGSTFAATTDPLLFDVFGTPLTAVPEPSPFAMLAILALGGVAAGAMRKSQIEQQ